MVGRDRADLGDHVAGHRLRLRLQRFDDGSHGFLDATLDRARIGPGGDVLGALAIDGLGQERRRRRAVAGDIRGLARDFLHHLRAQVLERILQLDLPGHRDAVLGDGRRPEALAEDDVASPGPERDLDRIGEAVDPAENCLARLLAVRDVLGHRVLHPTYARPSAGLARLAARVRSQRSGLAPFSAARTSSSRMTRYSSPSSVIS